MSLPSGRWGRNETHLVLCVGGLLLELVAHLLFHVSFGLLELWHVCVSLAFGKLLGLA